jgi:broad specificity phosphatase PhoE
MFISLQPGARTVKIYLLRHGETDWSKIGRLQGHTDIPLNERGIQQIKSAGEYFSRLGEKIDAIISSPLVRAKKSAEIVADKIGFPKENIIIEPNFIERCFGLGEGLDTKERNEKLTGVDWKMESVENLTERAGAIKKYAKEYFGKTLLITAHGSIIKAILVSATNGAFSYAEGLAILMTGEFCLLEYNGEVFSLVYERKNPEEELARLSGGLANE